MKVLFINAVCGTGSTGRIVTDLAAMLRSQGDTAKVAFGVGQARNIPPGDAVKINSPLGYYTHNALSRLTDHAGLYSKAQTRYLIREIERFDPDIVHIHNLHGYYVNYPMLMDDLTKTGTPIVMTLHDCWTFTGHCAHFDRVGCEQWKTRCRCCPQLHRYPVCYTRGDVGGNFDRKQAAFTAPENLHIVTPSRWLAELAGQSFLGKHPIRVIPNGVDTGIFRPTPGATLPKGRPIVLGAANVWDETKGLSDFMTLARLLGDDFQIVLVGLTSRQKKALPPNILGICRTDSQTQLARLYSAADIFVNPTYEDTFPTVNLEAQACGTPVVTYASGGAPETLLPGMGRAVSRGDVAALARVVRQGLPVPEHIPTEHLDKANAYRQYLELYRRLAGG